MKKRESLLEVERRVEKRTWWILIIVIAILAVLLIATLELFSSEKTLTGLAGKGGGGGGESLDSEGGGTSSAKVVTDSGGSSTVSDAINSGARISKANNRVKTKISSIDIGSSSPEIIDATIETTKSLEEAQTELEKIKDALRSDPRSDTIKKELEKAEAIIKEIQAAKEKVNGVIEEKIEEEKREIRKEVYFEEDLDEIIVPIPEIIEERELEIEYKTIGTVKAVEEGQVSFVEWEVTIDIPENRQNEEISIKHNPEANLLITDGKDFANYNSNDNKISIEKGATQVKARYKTKAPTFRIEEIDLNQMQIVVDSPISYTNVLVEFPISKAPRGFLDQKGFDVVHEENPSELPFAKTTLGKIQLIVKETSTQTFTITATGQDPIDECASTIENECPEGCTALENPACDNTCGNGILEGFTDIGTTIGGGTEACDDGNNINGDGCNSECQNEYCGDGIINDHNEMCDFGFGNSDTGACNAQCQLSYCGDGVVCDEETCTTGQNNGPEACDDGNTNNADACSNSCATPACGDGIFQAVFEQCEVGINGHTIETCDPVFCECLLPGCEGAIGGLEEIECGNGIIEGTEACDDGNYENGDGCGSCQIETGWQCPTPGSSCNGDLDGDGLDEQLGEDLCAETPQLGTQDTEVDENGCTELQIDPDNDGFCNIEVESSIFCLSFTINPSPTPANDETNDIKNYFQNQETIDDIIEGQTTSSTTYNIEPGREFSPGKFSQMVLSKSDIVQFITQGSEYELEIESVTKDAVIIKIFDERIALSLKNSIGTVPLNGENILAIRLDEVAVNTESTEGAAAFLTFSVLSAEKESVLNLAPEIASLTQDESNRAAVKHSSRINFAFFLLALAIILIIIAIVYFTKIRKKNNFSFN